MVRGGAYCGMKACDVIGKPVAVEHGSIAIGKVKGLVRYVLVSGGERRVIEPGRLGIVHHHFTAGVAEDVGSLRRLLRVPDRKRGFVCAGGGGSYSEREQTRGD